MDGKKQGRKNVSKILGIVACVLIIPHFLYVVQAWINPSPESGFLTLLLLINSLFSGTLSVIGILLDRRSLPSIIGAVVSIIPVVGVGVAFFMVLFLSS